MAAGNYNLKAIISVVDRVTGPMRGIVRSLQGPAEALHGVADASVLVGRRIAGVLGPMTGLSAIAGMFTLDKIVTDVASFGDQLSKQALRIGVSIEALQQLRYAGDMAGASQEKLDGALMAANKTLAEAASGKDEGAGELYRKLGIQMKDSSGQIRSMADIMPELADAFAANEDPAARAGMAMALFGKAGQDLIPLLAGGGDAMRAMMDEAAKYGLVTQEQAKAAEAFNNAQGRLNAALLGLRNTIGAQLLPRLQPLVDGFTEWVATNREFLATKVDGVVGRIADALKEIDFKALIEGVDRFLFGYEKVLDADGNEVERIAGLFDQIGAAIRTVSQVLAPVVDRFGAANVALGGLAVLVGGPLIASLVTLATALAGPVGLAVAGIALGAWAIYENWEGIAGWFSDLWGSVETIFGGVSEFIAGIFAGDTARAVEDIRAVWDGLTGYWSTLWDGLTGLLSSAISGLDGLIGTWLPQPAIDAWDGLLKFFDGLWTDITATFDWAWGHIEPIVSRIADAVSLVSGGIGAVQDVASTVGGAISSGISAVGEGIGGAWDYVTGGEDQPAAPSPVANPVLAAGTQTQQIGGKVTIEINGLPPGSKVNPEFPKQGPEWNLDAGYRSLAMGF